MGNRGKRGGGRRTERERGERERDGGAGEWTDGLADRRAGRQADIM